MAGGGEKSKVPEQEVDAGTGLANGGAPTLDEQQQLVGNAAVIDMMNDKKLADGVSTLQLAAEEELGKRAQTMSERSSPGDQQGYPLEISVSGIQSEGYAYWRGEERREPIWDLTLEGIPTITHIGTDEGYLMNSHEMSVNMQSTITFEGESFDDWGIASFRYGGRFDVSPLMGAVSSGGGWGVVGTM